MATEEAKLGVAALVLRTDYITPRPHIFPSEGALDWYIREHKTALIDCGAITLIRGRWLIAPAAFDSHVLQAGMAAAAKKAIA